jgi:hypothetical protein
MLGPTNIGFGINEYWYFASAYAASPSVCKE